MESEFLTRHQALAAEQLNDIAFASDDAMEVVQIEPPSSEGGSMVVRLSWDTSGYEKVGEGLAFRVREPLRIYVPGRFPLEPPTAYFTHARFIGFPHIQWGNHICLYQATDVEWATNDGMFGFIKRLDQWLRDAALNQLDPDDAPLHPPAIYSSSNKKITIEINAPEIPKSEDFWIGTAKLSKRNNLCFDLTDWSDLPAALPEGERFAAALLLSQPMPMEYPNTVSKLISVLIERGVPFGLLFSILKLFAVCQEEDEPLYFLLGAPMRRRAAGEPLRQHLTAWSIAPNYVAALRSIVRENSDGDAEAAWNQIIEWATNANTEWCQVYENRPEVTFRRDHDTSANWFFGKKIAILGCGALGSHISEYVVRAGASTVRLVDNSTVNPGILVRQQFLHRMVGYSKQGALDVELAAINPKADIGHVYANLIKGWPESLTLDDFDLVIDATASRRVAVSLQLHLEEIDSTPPILRCAISGRASHGIATLKMNTSCYGPYDLIRQTKLAASKSPELSEFMETFWPEKQGEPGFQPEPGCSEPTFVGSAADVAFFSSSFFQFAAHALVSAPEDAAQAFYVSSANVDNLQKSMASWVVDLGKPTPETEALAGYRVLVSQKAKKSIQSEIALNRRTGSARDETGGLLLGEIDDSLSTISIDAATGAPPDSVKSAELFVCGIKGTDRQCRYHAKTSGGSTRFVGVWHTHPISMPEPSDVDLQAMAQILHMQEKTPRHVVMLIIGHAATEPVWQFHLFRRNQFKIMKAQIGG